MNPVFISQKTAFFIVVAVKTSNLTIIFLFLQNLNRLQDPPGLLKVLGCSLLWGKVAGA
jgi:hypothetical protein